MEPHPTESTLKVIKEEEPDDITLRKQIQPVGFFRLFRFADKTDKLLIACGTLGAVAVGAAMPMFSLLWGNMTDSFQSSTSDPQVMVDTAKGIMYNFLEIGAGVFCACWVMMACWMISGERQAIKCRTSYLQALLRQEIGWFDRVDQTQLSSKFSTETFSFQQAIGEKVGVFIKIVATLIVGFTIAYVKGWQMALVVTAGIPAVGLTGVMYVGVLQSKDKKTAECYNEAGGKAEQVLGAIKTVKALNGQAYESAAFQLKLMQAIKKSFKYAFYAGAGIGGVFGAMLACYSLGFWYGSSLVQNKVKNMGEPYTAGDVLVVFFSIILGGFQLSNLTPCLKKFTEGQSAAGRIYAIIDRVPSIQNDPLGKTIDNLIGNIKFENVHFSYPKEPQRKILNGINLQIRPNQTTAFVGESGCGKSTIMQLLMRFYDPQSGRITLDGIDIKELKLSWLRQNIGYVGQEPILFATSIKQNMLFGKPSASEQELVNALKSAQAYKFVMDLEKKMDTYVGYGGGQLSGGQKQRIAIARAILKNPRILLLDEATSALDRKNQKLIQITLNNISSGRTTISIAHRTKTIMTAGNIIVVHKGLVKESGQFKDLERFKDFHGQLQDQNNQQEQQQKQELGLQGQQEQDKIVADVKQAAKQEPKQARKSIRRNSITKQEQQKEVKKEHENNINQKYKDQVFKRMLGYTKPDFKYLIFGFIAAMINGTIFPIFSIFLAKMIGILIEMQLGIGSQKAANDQALIFLGLAIAMFLANFVQNSVFSIVGDRLTMRIRTQVFNKMIKMPGGWFDDPKNNAGSLTARLSTDCKNINGVTSSYMGIIIQNISCLLSGIIIAFCYDWRITLVTLGMIPFMLAAGFIQMKVFVGFSQSAGQAYKDSSNLIMEALINIRTVTSFGVENTFSAKYAQLLIKPLKMATRKGNIAGLLFGFSQLVMFIIFALVFYIGSIFVRNYGVTITNLFAAIYAIIFAAMTAGNNAQMMPDIASCNTSAAYLFLILDGEDQDQMQIRERSLMLTEGGTKGNFEMKSISFKYPTRNFNAFTNLSMSIKSGTKVAFVGPSGCGKSTIMQMLLRFYDPTEGEILLDGININNFDVHYLRSLYGLVSQEPVLFNTSFAQNIKYNKSDATMDDIRMAATKANAISFIETGDGQGFNRGVGVKGSQISGGQKQRVAIARAILRNPNILLLDQATSALDSQNQKLVQDSLDHMMVGRTSVSIAHRIETIRNSDCIFVFSGGQIVESGNYQELFDKKGHFYDMEQGNYK